MLMLSLILIGLPLQQSVLNMCGLTFIVNLNFILINISPFSANDGYYMLMTKIGLNGIRIKMWKLIGQIFKMDFKIEIPTKYKLLMLLYAFCSLGFILINLILLLQWLINIIIEIF